MTPQPPPLPMSDIPGAPMSHNDPIREEVRCCDCDFTTTVYSDEVRAFYRFHRCWPPTERTILVDLIAELRGYADDGYIMGASTVRELCTRVEEDLRECVQ